MRRLRNATLLALALLAFAFPTISYSDVGTVPSELGDEVLRLEPVHLRVIEAAMAELESIEFPPNALDVDNSNYEIVLLENENFYSVVFMDKVRIEDCDHPSGSTFAGSPPAHQISGNSP